MINLNRLPVQFKCPYCYHEKQFEIMGGLDKMIIKCYECNKDFLIRYKIEVSVDVMTHKIDDTEDGYIYRNTIKKEEGA